MATILVAEDRAALRQRVRRMVEQAGHTVELARNGAEAVDLFETVVRQAEGLGLSGRDVAIGNLGYGQCLTALGRHSDAEGRLLAAHASPGAAIANGATALHIAAKSGCDGAVRALLDAEADVDTARSWFTR